MTTDTPRIYEPVIIHAPGGPEPDTPSNRADSILYALRNEARATVRLVGTDRFKIAPPPDGMEEGWLSFSDSHLPRILGLLISEQTHAEPDAGARPKP